jgi:uncharacterized coiled-coil protein SlyX
MGEMGEVKEKVAGLRQEIAEVQGRTHHEVGELRRSENSTWAMLKKFITDTGVVNEENRLAHQEFTLAHQEFRLAHQEFRNAFAGIQKQLTELTERIPQPGEH